MNKGLIYGIAAYVFWGLSPIYWKWMQEVSSTELLIHRMIWSLLFLIVLLALRRQWLWLGETLCRPKMLISLAAAAILLSINWFAYIWAVNNGRIVEASLGYFVTPLLSVLLGVIVLRERLRPMQWVAVALAAVGVLYLTLIYGSLPWVSLALAFSFAGYGLLKKKIRLAALESLSVEMAFLFLPALAYLLWLQNQGMAEFGNTSVAMNLLLISTGAFTAIPLLWFTAAARRIPLSTIGILQYIAPTLQFLIGVFVFNETFTAARLIGFCIIWLALFLYSLENLYAQRKNRRQVIGTSSASP